MNYTNTQVRDEYADEYDSGAVGEAFDLQHYLRILRKHKWLIVLFSSAVTALAAYYAFTATPIYRASSTLLIEQQKANMVSIEELYGVDTENADYYETQYQLLRSRGLAQRIVERLNLWEHPELSNGATGAVQQQEMSGDQALAGDSMETLPVSEDSESSARTSSGFSQTVLGLLDQVGLGGAAGSRNDADASEVTEGLSANEAAMRELALSSDNLAQSSIPGITASDIEGQGPALTPKQERTISRFMSRLSISPVRNTKLVNISFDSEDPVFAARVANVVGDEYIQSFLDAKLELTTTASTWLNERLGELKADLDAAEDRLISFQQANDLVDVQGSVGRLNEQQLLLDTAELTQARSELASARDVYNDVRALENNPELLETIPAVQADPLVQRTKIEQGAVQRELDELLNRYGERHPRVLDVKSELASLEGALAGHIRRISGTLAKDFQLAQQRVASINAKLASGRSEIQLIGNKKFELDALQREVETKRGIYDQYFSRMTEAASADGLETANARISDFARVPVEPVKPKKQLIIALAGLASLVLSMLMAFLYETMDDTVKGTRDVEVKLGQKLLGLLPMVKAGLFQTVKTLPLNPDDIPDKNGTFFEAVNTVRTALTLDDGDKPAKIILVTSSVPGEGKSTASINLAYSLGQLERVLLIDCDMRKPTVAKAAGLDKNVDGLSSLIAQTASAQACIHRGAFGGKVDILPSGPIPQQPLELLSSKRFERILGELSRHYDRIVIDSAPTQAVSDALVLGKLADGVVYVVKAHATSMDLVSRGLQRLQEARAPLSGILVSQVDIEKISSYGGDYFFQGYYDYYGYRDKTDSKRRQGKINLTQEELLAIRNDDSDVRFDLDTNYNGNSTVAYENGFEPAPDARRVNGAGAPAHYRDRAEPRRSEPARQPRQARAKRPRFEDDLDIM